MFRIFDGREHFYQWDSDCKLIIDDGRISAVHFCNRTIDYAIVCNVYKENGQYLVNVPNIFFQSDRDLHVYAYDDNHTLYEETYKVYARSKPADYVYKDDEVLTWARIEQRVTDLENTVSTEGIAQAVQDYMAANPIQIPDEYLTESELEAKGYITTIPSNYVTEESLSSKGFLTQNDVPTKVSQLENDANYQTAEQVSQGLGEALNAILPAFGDDVVTTTLEQVDARGYATTNYVDDSVSDKVTEAQMNTAIENALATIVDGEEVQY